MIKHFQYSSDCSSSWFESIVYLQFRCDDWLSSESLQEIQSLRKFQTCDIFSESSRIAAWSYLLSIFEFWYFWAFLIFSNFWFNLKSTRWRVSLRKYFRAYINFSQFNFSHRSQNSILKSSEKHRHTNFGTVSIAFLKIMLLNLFHREKTENSE